MGMLLFIGTFSSFTTTTVKAKSVKKITQRQQERFVGYFDKNGITYGVWVEEGSDGFGQVTSVYFVEPNDLSIVSFSGTIDPSGVVRVGVVLSDETDFYYSGRPRANP